MSYEIDELKELGREIGKIGGVEAVILYGSYARGDYDEGSDVDLLIIFQNQLSRKREWHKIINLTAKRKFFIQAVTMTIDELKSSSLLSSILREGKTLYSTQSFDLKELAEFKPYVLITYDLSKMSPTHKTRFLQNLYGRRSGKYQYKGILAKLHGFKVGRGCLIITLENASKLTNLLEKEGITYFVRYVWCD